MAAVDYTIAPLTVIKPIVITDAMLTSHSVAEDEAVYDAGDTYSIGDVRRYGDDHDLFSSLQNSNMGNTPIKWPDSTSFWYDEGKTMRWNMFDLTTNIQTEGTSPMIVVLEPGEPITALSFDTLESDTIIINEAVSGYSKTIDTRTRDVTDWYSYWYEPFRYRRIVSVYDIPAGVSAPVITVTFISSTGTAKCGGFVMGRHYTLGLAQLDGSSHTRQGFSVFERDEVDPNRVRLLKRGAIKKPTVQAFVQKNRIDQAMGILDDIDGIPAAWSVKTDSSNPWYGAFALRGVYRSPVRISPIKNSDDAFLNLDLEGF